MDVDNLKRPELIALCKEKEIEFSIKDKNDELKSKLKEQFGAKEETAEIKVEASEPDVKIENTAKKAENKKRKVVKAYWLGKADRKYLFGEFDDEETAKVALLKKGYKRHIIE